MQKSLVIWLLVSLTLLLGFVTIVNSAQQLPDAGPFSEIWNVITDMNNSVNSLMIKSGEFMNTVASLNEGITSLGNRISALENNSQAFVPSFFDIFVEIEGIKGESTDEKHREWIDADSFSWGVTQSGSSGTGGGSGAGKADFSDFTIVKKLDKSSVNLYLTCASGEHIPQVKIEFCRATGDKQCYMEYKLTDVIVTGCKSSGSGIEEKPIEEISFNYGKIEWKYTEIGEDGKPKGQVKGGWDIAQNKKI